MTTGNKFRADDPSLTSAVALITGVIITVAALVGICFGGPLAVLDLSRRDASGLVTSDWVALSTTTYALATDDQRVSTGSSVVPRPWLETVRIRVAAADGAPVFVGIARTGDVRRYLSGVAYTAVTRIGEDRPAYDHDGGPPGLLPGELAIWRVQSAGPGEQTITWPVENGDWTLVVMRPDGAAGLDVRVEGGVTAPALRWTWIVVLAVSGTALVLGAGAVAVVRQPKAGPSPLRPGRRRRSNEKASNHHRLKGRS
ncbi:hypothetical protein ACI2LF_12455 [Kribbella sp. NPDC020789]